MNCATTFPSRQEREKIFERRVDLLQKVLPVMASTEPDDVVNQKMDVLTAAYGEADMRAVLQFTYRNQAFKEVSRHMTEKQRKHALYREYLSSYMRFGRDLPFLPFREYHRSLNDHQLVARALGDGATMSVETAEHVNRQAETLLGSMLLWEDITPENPPACLPPEAAPYL